MHYPCLGIAELQAQEAVLSEVKEQQDLRLSELVSLHTDAWTTVQRICRNGRHKKGRLLSGTAGNIHL